MHKLYQSGSLLEPNINEQDVIKNISWELQVCSRILVISRDESVPKYHFHTFLQELRRQNPIYSCCWNRIVSFALVVVSFAVHVSKLSKAGHYVVSMFPVLLGPGIYVTKVIRSRPSSVLFLKLLISK